MLMTLLQATESRSIFRNRAVIGSCFHSFQWNYTFHVSSAVLLPLEQFIKSVFFPGQLNQEESCCLCQEGCGLFNP